MMLVMLVLLLVRVKGYPYNYVARLTQGIPQRPASSQALSNLFINALAKNAEARVRARRGNGAVFMVADEVLIQAKPQEILQELKYISSEFRKDCEAQWAIRKCVEIFVN